MNTDISEGFGNCCTSNIIATQICIKQRMSFSIKVNNCQQFHKKCSCLQLEYLFFLSGNIEHLILLPVDWMENYGLNIFHKMKFVGVS